jgi:hypothetical protein
MCDFQSAVPGAISAKAIALQSFSPRRLEFTAKNPGENYMSVR